jgi:hypothetical protein
MSFDIGYKYSEQLSEVVSVREGWKDADGTVASVYEKFQTRNGPYYSVVFTYKVDGGYYSGTFSTFEEYHENDAIYLRFDPANPERNDLVERERIKHWILFAVILVAALSVLFAAMHEG